MNEATARKAVAIEERPMLAVQGLTKIHGRGCPHCLELTGPAMGGNRCPQCGSIVACADVNLTVYPGEIVGIVGESGSGKSTLMKCLHFDEPPTTGSVYLSKMEDGHANLFDLSLQKKRWVCNHLIGIVYQNPMMGLRLDFSSGGNIAEKLIAADWYHIGDIRERAGYLLKRTEIPLDRMDDLPKNFSGGMQQRVQIAKALANDPPLLLLDEITTGLDVSVQAQILDLIRQLKRALGITMVVVSHDFGVIRMLTERTFVMKDGRVVEQGLTDQILEDPQHPYTQLLVNSML
jgi:putative phosphonate transport system ATP-binding protein